MALTRKKAYKLLQKDEYKPLDHLFLITPLIIDKIISKKIKPNTILSEKPVNAPGLALNQKFQVKKFPILIDYPRTMSSCQHRWECGDKFL